jgi:hypothetical protein
VRPAVLRQPDQVLPDIGALQANADGLAVGRETIPAFLRGTGPNGLSGLRAALRSVHKGIRPVVLTIAPHLRPKPLSVSGIFGPAVRSFAPRPMLDQDTGLSENFTG